MAVHVVLLRGINLGSRNRISMPELRGALEEAGYDDVQTYVQSGNVVLSSGKSAAAVAREVERLIAERFGLEIAVVTRTRSELARVVERNPVSFLEAKPKAELVRKLEAAAVDSERVVAAGREIYAWHPAGVARSKLWSLLAGQKLGVTATARNWTTVTKLLELADPESK